MAARSKEVKQVSLADLGIEKGEPTETVLSMTDAEVRQAGEVVEDDGTSGVERIIAMLQSAKVVYAWLRSGPTRRSRLAGWSRSRSRC